MGTRLNPKRQKFQDRALEETVGRTDGCTSRNFSLSAERKASLP
jgi:hypothetical protein